MLISSFLEILSLSRLLEVAAEAQRGEDTCSRAHSSGQQSQNVTLGLAGHKAEALPRVHSDNVCALSEGKGTDPHHGQVNT